MSTLPGRGLHAAASLEVRSGLSEAHRAALEHFAQPGTWWNARERLAIFAEARLALECALCTQRRGALSPYAIDGTHDSSHALEPSTVEAVHRIRTDSGRLTKAWFEGVSKEMCIGAYVELVAIVSVAVIIDTFAESLGLPFVDLPEPVEGEPSRMSYEDAVDDGAWVPITKRGPETRANIVRALGAVPRELENFWQVFRHHYLAPEGRAIAQPQIELVASRTSALNQCFY